jgi:hypothetical protein
VDLALRYPLNFNNAQTLICNIDKSSEMATILKKSSLFIQDECTMVHKKSFEAFDHIIKTIKTTNYVKVKIVCENNHE